ncbi:MAG: tetratricopeptide repeat protein [Cyanobacteria bacterium]|nr:tetratricopeptide repeat protein [Cyanobacteriota bacterium]
MLENIRIRSSILSVSAILLSLLTTFPEQATAKDKSKGNKRTKVVYNYDLFDRGRTKKNSRIHQMHSSLALAIDDVDRAIKLSRRAVKLDPNDIDARVALGEALYEKIEQEGEDYTAADYNECVKTWLIVYRNIVGDEAALSYKGMSLPFANKFFEDEDRGVIAKSMLMRLCGHVPKCWETNNKYLSKVLRPETTVAGEIVESREEKIR